MPVTSQDTDYQRQLRIQLEFPTYPKAGNQVWKRVFTCLAAMAVALLSLEVAARIIVSIGNPNWGSNREYDVKHILACKPPAWQKTQVFLIGASYTKMAAYPELIERILQEHGYAVEIRNLATPGSTEVEQLSLLKTAIACGNKPALVVSDLRPTAWSVYWRHHQGLKDLARYENSYLGRCTIDGASKDPVARMRGMFERTSIFYGFQPYLRSTILDWMKMAVSPWACRRNSFVYADNNDSNSGHGWSPRYEVMDSTDLIPGSKAFTRFVHILKDYVGPAPIEWTDESIHSVRDYCASQHIPLLFVWYPVNPGLHRAWSAAAIDMAAMTERFKKIPGANVMYMDMHDSDPDSNDFTGGTHVNAIGAIKYSRVFAEKLMAPPLRPFLGEQKQATAMKSSGEVEQ